MNIRGFPGVLQGRGAIVTSGTVNGWSKRECPLWVTSGHVQRTSSCPLYPRKRHQKREDHMMEFSHSLLRLPRD